MPNKCCSLFVLYSLLGTDTACKTSLATIRVRLRRLCLREYPASPQYTTVPRGTLQYLLRRGVVPLNNLLVVTCAVSNKITSYE